MNRVYKEDIGIPKEVYYFMGLFTIPLLILFLFGIYKQLIMDQSFGDKPMSDTGLIIFTVCFTGFVIIMFWGMSTMRMKIRVADGQITFRFAPFVSKDRTYLLNNIESWEIKKRNPLLTGIGLRYDIKTGSTVYTPGSRYVLHIKVREGSNVMLGTRNPEGLRSAIESSLKRDYE